jgi:hypothetical protein
MLFFDPAEGDSRRGLILATTFSPILFCLCILPFLQKSRSRSRFSSKPQCQARNYTRCASSEDGKLIYLGLIGGRCWRRGDFKLAYVLWCSLSYTHINTQGKKLAADKSALLWFRTLPARMRKTASLCPDLTERMVNASGRISFSLFFFSFVVVPLFTTLIAEPCLLL